MWRWGRRRRFRERRRCWRGRSRAGGCGYRCSAARTTTSSPMAAASCSIARRRDGSTPSFSAAGRSTARPTSIWWGSAPTRRRPCGGPAPGAAYLYFLVPRVILFREEHSRRVLVPRVDFVSAPGTSAEDVHRPGGPHALVTGLCAFSFDRARRRFRLTSVHPGHSVDEVRANTGFAFDAPDDVPQTPSPEPSC